MKKRNFLLQNAFLFKKKTIFNIAYFSFELSNAFEKLFFSELGAKKNIR